MDETYLLKPPFFLTLLLNFLFGEMYGKVIPRSARRFSTSAVKAKKWWVGKEMQLPPEQPSERPHPPPSKAEEMRVKQRRITKAERDERMDITMALTPVKE